MNECRDEWRWVGMDSRMDSRMDLISWAAMFNRKMENDWLMAWDGLVIGGRGRVIVVERCPDSL